MGCRYIPEDLIRRSDFYDWYCSFSPDTKERIRQMVDRLLRENPTCRLPFRTGPGYLMMHWLMGDLFTSLAIYLIRKKEGDPPEILLARIDSSLTAAGRKINRLVKRLMKLPGAFFLARHGIPKAMTLANGCGFQVAPADYGKNAFGFDVTECPYCRLYAAYGVPEIGPVFCRFDDTLASGMDNLEFIRNGTLCQGSDKCDFLYRKRKVRPEKASPCRRK